MDRIRVLALLYFHTVYRLATGTNEGKAHDQQLAITGTRLLFVAAIIWSVASITIAIRLDGKPLHWSATIRGYVSESISRITTLIDDSS